MTSSTRTITRKPSVATATKWPDSRISTSPTSSAISATSAPAISVASRKPIGKPATVPSRWIPASQALEVTWDSTKPNSYFYRPLGNILAKNDDFALRFDLRLDSILAGANPDKPSTFQIAAGFLNVSAATNATFSLADAIFLLMGKFLSNQLVIAFFTLVAF